MKKKIKKIVNFVTSNVIGFSIGLVAAITLGVYAATTLSSSSVYYNNANSGGSSNTVSGALDELYNMANSLKRKKCERATLLHTETCTNSKSNFYCQADGYALGDTITYGNLGTSGTLASGDAFDCDVNGDGVYDATTERFYYVSDKTNGVTTDSNTAVLIYYNNVSAGEPSNSKGYAYNTDSFGYLGPQTAKAQLPTTSQWSNVSLTSTTRDITDEKSTTRVSGFSYEGYVARLLTTQEVSAGCGFTVGSYTKGELSSKCKYLMENTQYSSSSLTTDIIWLETLPSSYSGFAWAVQGGYRGVFENMVSYSSTYGVRPAIEVLKSDISY